jgi:type VI secretion system protein ImpJ
MNSLSRVVWWEGMYLGPQHFQAQTRYFEEAIRFCVSLLWSYSFGLTSCIVDIEALKNGTMSLLRAGGIMPDGLVFNMPEGDALPPPRNFVKLFPPTRYNVTVLLAITPRQPGGLNCVLEEEQAHAGVRFIGQPTTITDETTGRDTKPVRLGKKNFRLLLDLEVPADAVTLPVARITRSGSGEYVPDPEFVPPCLQLGASPRLMSLTGRLIEIMEEKSSSLSRSAQGVGRFNFSSRDIASFWFLHTVNASIATLRHLHYSKRGHPEELFVELLRLAGGLCTFALDSHPRMLPAYDHLHPDISFSALDKQIRDHLELIIPTNCISIAMAKTDDYFYAGEITDERCVGRASWILGVRSDIGELDLITKVPQLIKICSAKFVGDLVRRAMPGLAVAHLATLPASVAPRAETQYFLINRSGPFWENIVQTRRVGIYVPGDIPNPELDLLAILES